MKFLCDQMLAGMGRWLRTAGYDTKIITQATQDQAIFDCALAENRLLLTRDRHFLNRQPQKCVVFLKSNSLEQCIGELNTLLSIDWLYHPFSRCLLCNTLFIAADERIVAEQAPVEVRQWIKEFLYCSHCHKVYWQGSHAKRMLAQLHHWQKLNY